MHTIPHGLKKTATLCILKSGPYFLLLQRLKEPNKGLYTPVGGKLDPFESPMAAALRETREETGIAVPAVRYAGILTESAPTGYNWVNFVYWAEIDFVPAPPCPEGTLAWIHTDELLQVPTPPTDWHIYRYLLGNKPFAFSALFDADLNLLEMTEEIEGVRVC